MTVIYYSKKVFSPGPEKDARLLYVCRADRAQTSLPSAFHSHEENLELLYVHKGKGVFRIDNQLYHVSAGDLVIYNSGVIHDECADPEAGMWFYNCGVKGLKLPGLKGNHLIAEDISPVLHCGSLQKSMYDLFVQMYEQLSGNGKAAEMACQYLLSTLLVQLMYQAEWSAKIKENKKDNVFIDLKAYIDSNYAEDISVEDLSRRVHMSTSNMTHQFKKHTGFSPIQYIIRRRIGKAQAMLISSDKSITEISASIGYDNISYFNNQFKKIVGMAPQNYRKYRVGDNQYKRLNQLCELWEHF